eukprot:1190768-Prorocentrum_minimum.AAC.1
MGPPVPVTARAHTTPRRRRSPFSHQKGFVPIRFARPEGLVRFEKHSYGVQKVDKSFCGVRRLAVVKVLVSLRHVYGARPTVGGQVLNRHATPLHS